MRYFKPRKDVECRDSLLPQKIAGRKQYRFRRQGNYEDWAENYGDPDMDLLAKNFIEVKTEAEAIEGY